MSRKEKLLAALNAKPMPKDFTIDELDTLMGQCGCEKWQGGRGSGIRYEHIETGRALTFDGPHPEKTLNGLHIKKSIQFLRQIGAL